MKALRLASVLAVAAIVTVAAVLLKPVIQQAREASLVDTCLERAGNLGDALLSYAEINDGNLPLAFAYGQAERRYRWQQVIPYPANWNFTSLPQRIQEDLCTWANATLALSKNDKNYFCPATEIIHFPRVEYRIKRPLPAAMTYTFNGLLHGYPIANIEGGAATVIAWEGLGAVTLNGYAIANPTLECSRGKACRFGSASSRFLMPLEDPRTYKQSCVAIMGDGRSIILPIDAIYGQVIEGKPTNWLSGDDNPLRFAPKLGKHEGSSDKFYNILPPDTERLLPKRP